MNLIRNASQIIMRNHIRALVYGQPGIGKTTLAMSCPKPLIFDYDDGVQRVHFAHLENADVVQIKSHKDCLDVLNDYDLSAYESIVFDTGGKCLDHMGDWIISMDPKYGKRGGGLTLQGYGVRKNEFQALNRKVNSLGKHVIYVAHRDTRQEGDDTRYVPQFGGSNYDALVTDLDLVGYMEANGRDRTITFDPTSRSDGKNTCNLPSLMKLPIIVDNEGNATGVNNFMTKAIIEPYLKRIEDRQSEIEEFGLLMEEIKSDIGTISDVEGVNAFVAAVDSYDHKGNSKRLAAGMIAGKAKELNLTFDKPSKMYIDPTAKPKTKKAEAEHVQASLIDENE